MLFLFSRDAWLSVTNCESSLLPTQNNTLRHIKTPWVCPPSPVELWSSCLRSHFAKSSTSGGTSLGYAEQDRKKDRTTSFTRQWIKDTLAKQHEKCFCCHQKLDNSFTLDRLWNNTGHVEKNMVISCLSCNKAHSDKSIWRFRDKKKEEAFYEKYGTKLPCINAQSEEEIFNIMREKGIVGGPSMVFHRYHRVKSSEEEGTRIRHTVARKRQERFVVSMVLHERHAMRERPISGRVNKETDQENCARKPLRFRTVFHES